MLWISLGVGVVPGVQVKPLAMGAEVKGRSRDAADIRMTRKQRSQLRELMKENGPRFWSRSKHTGKTKRPDEEAHACNTSNLGG